MRPRREILDLVFCFLGFRPLDEVGSNGESLKLVLSDVVGDGEQRLSRRVEVAHLRAARKQRELAALR